MSYIAYNQKYEHSFRRQPIQPLLACYVCGHHAVVSFIPICVCLPIRTELWYFWTSAATIEKYCDNTDAIELGFVVSDVATDLMILAIPLPIV